MEVSQTNRYITPTLQANWNLAISDVIRCLNANLVFEAWLSLETLYDILPPEIHKEMTKKYQEIKKEFEGQATDSVSFEDLLSSYVDGQNVLRRHIRPFFREMYEALYKGNYLEKRPRDIETNAPAALLEQ